MSEKFHYDSDGFLQLAQLLKEKSGIHLINNEKNISLVHMRIRKLAKDNNIQNFSQFYKYLNGNTKRIRQFINLMTTNTTYFFREPKHFDHLDKLLTTFKNRKRNTPGDFLRIWCCASSTGEEPYTIAMVLHNKFNQLVLNDIKFLATDIDPNVLEVARNGVYEKKEVSKIPITYSKYYFEKLPAKESSYCKVSRDIKNLVTFAEFNLKESFYPFKKKFDIIFCRNVLIYFDQKHFEETVDKLLKSLETGGYLFIGHAEGGRLQRKNLKKIYHSVYQKLSDG